MTGIFTYGDIEPTSNFFIVFNDIEDEIVWVAGNPNEISKGYFETWDEAVAFFVKIFPDNEIAEITAG